MMRDAGLLSAREWLLRCVLATMAEQLRTTGGIG
jgi:hypothetical protein